MATIADGLLVAVRSLPKADKADFLRHLLEDGEVRQTMAEYLVEKLAEPRGSQEKSHRSEVIPPPSFGERELERNVTPKERGRRLREGYISDLQKLGIQLDQIDSTWAVASSGLWVAIPFATERRPDRWFLGLPESKMLDRVHSEGVALVLLCQSASGSLLDFVLPPGKIQEVVNLLSKSKGQLKFNITKVGNRYHLLIPGHGPLDVSSYKGEVSALAS